MDRGKGKYKRLTIYIQEVPMIWEICVVNKSHAWPKLLLKWTWHFQTIMYLILLSYYMYFTQTQHITYVHSCLQLCTIHYICLQLSTFICNSRQIYAIVYNCIQFLNTLTVHLHNYRCSLLSTSMNYSHMSKSFNDCLELSTAVFKCIPLSTTV